MKWLDIGLINCNKKEENNQWTGTLKPLKNLTKLEWICLGTTDVNGGIEYLSNTVTYISCQSDDPNKKCLELKKKFRDYIYDKKIQIELYKLINCQFNEERFKEIFKELDEFNSDKEIHGESMFSLFRTKMLYSAISSNFADKSLVTSLQNEINYLQTENNKYSGEIINLNKQVEEYKKSQRITLEEVSVSHLSIQNIRGLDIESLQNKLTEANQNADILWREIDLNKSENIKLTKRNEEFQNEFINNNFLI